MTYIPRNDDFDPFEDPPKKSGGAFNDPSHVYLLALLSRADVLRMPVDEALVTAREWHAACVRSSISIAVPGPARASALQSALALITVRDDRWQLLLRWARTRGWTRRYRRRLSALIDALARPAQGGVQ